VSLTETTGPLTAVQDLLTAHMPEGWRTLLDEGEYAVGTVTVETVTPPRTEYFVMGGPDKAHMLIQTTTAASTRTGARVAGDKVRTILTGVDRRNRLLTPISRDGFVFDNPTTTADGHADLVDGTHLWVETFTLAWQDRTE